MKDLVVYIFISIWNILCCMTAILITEYLNERKKKNEISSK